MKLAIKLLMLLEAVVVITIGGVLLTTRAASRNPLVDYLAIMPGHSIAGLENFPCQLRIGMSKGVQVGFCQFDAASPVFGRVTVVMTDGLITRLAFEVKPEQLRAGALVLCWGEPSQAAVNGEGLAPVGNLRWNNSVYAGLLGEDSEGRLDYFRPVTYLSLEAGAVPCNSVD